MSFNLSEYLTLAQQLAGKANISASQELQKLLVTCKICQVLTVNF